MLLAVETSAQTGSVALHEGGRIVAACHLGQPRDHGAHLGPAVANLLQNHRRPIDAYGFSAGPGSFTGLRIGLSFVKGLAAARPAPVVSVSSMQVRAATLARRRPTDLPILLLLDARRAGVYAGLFEPQWPHARRAELAPAAYRPEDLRAHPVSALRAIVGGDGLSVVGDVSPTWDIVRLDQVEPEAEVVAHLADEAFQRGAGEHAWLAEPDYWVRSAPEARRAAECSAPGGDDLTNPQALSTFGGMKLNGAGSTPSPRSSVYAKRDSE